MPIFSDSKEKVVQIGKEIKFSGEEKFIQERETIANEIQEELNRLAKTKNK